MSTRHARSAAVGWRRFSAAVFAIWQPRHNAWRLPKS